MEVIGRLTGGVAQDFNNFLKVIKGNLECLERRASADERIVRSIHNACDATSRAATLVHKLLAFARQQPLLPVCFDVNAFIREIMPLMSGGHPDSRIVLDLRACKSALIDPNQLENIFLNLIVNAHDAIAENGVSVRTRPCALERAQTGLDAGEYVLLEVEDKGVGMSRDVMERAFDPFFTTKPAARGTALGLSQAFGFARQSNGTVSPRSELGVGICVTLYMPQASEPVIKFLQQPQLTPQPAFRRAL